MSKVIESIALYFKEGTSDKVYNCTIEEAGSGHVVNFSYGRRGAALTTGTKTSSPVALDKARQVFEKLVKEKTGKGYKLCGVCPDGIPTVTPATTPTSSRCVLLNQVDEDKAEELIHDDAWVMQEKVDGVRLMVECTGRVIKGYNRLGNEVALPKKLEKELLAALLVGDKLRPCFDFLVDGELLGEVFHAFDIVRFNENSLENLPFTDRFDVLMKHWIDWDVVTKIKIVATAEGSDKRVLFDEIKEKKGEGVVFKRSSAKYRVGRPASGGDYLKFKFTADCTCIVAEINDKRSVRLSLMDGKSVVNAGNVTIPSNHKVPGVGATVDVRYLYAFKESGCLFQPVYIGERSDIEAKSCTVKQLKYKPENDEN